MVSNQQLLANFGLMAILALEVFSAPSLQVEIKPRVDSGMPYAMLEEACLVSAPVGLPPHLSIPPFCRRQWPENRDFVLVTVFQYHLVGKT
jgi:hypothetical protein